MCTQQVPVVGIAIGVAGTGSYLVAPGRRTAPAGAIRVPPWGALRSVASVDGKETQWEADQSLVRDDQ